ncbi:hypothetical protein [Nocardioides pantholopis]|uniref:hypothetical protein n=1 Tax=Nocardioides pantholopis TaxID=2483798 RepID=UPI000F0920F4|nr:hypothetical protein [Nocardioides pantholopis]
MAPAPGERRPSEVVERFRPTSGRVVGVLGLLLAAVVVVVGLRDGLDLAVVVGAVVGGVLVWSAVLRPGLAVTSETLVMRNMLETTEIPLAAIEEVAVRQFTAVRAGGKRYVSPVVGQTMRQLRKGDRAATKPEPTASYPAFVEDRIRRLAADAAAARGIKRGTPEQDALARDVRRTPAWVELGLLLLGLVVFVVALVV